MLKASVGENNRVCTGAEPRRGTEHVVLVPLMLIKPYTFKYPVLVHTTR